VIVPQRPVTQGCTMSDIRSYFGVATRIPIRRPRCSPAGGPAPPANAPPDPTTSPVSPRDPKSPIQLAANKPRRPSARAAPASPSPRPLPMRLPIRATRLRHPTGDHSPRTPRPRRARSTKRERFHGR